MLSILGRAPDPGTDAAGRALARDPAAVTGGDDPGPDPGPDLAGGHDQGQGRHAGDQGQEVGQDPDQDHEAGEILVQQNSIVFTIFFNQHCHV